MPNSGGGSSGSPSPAFERVTFAEICFGGDGPVIGRVVVERDTHQKVTGVVVEIESINLSGADFLEAENDYDTLFGITKSLQPLLSKIYPAQERNHD